jgi:pyruvate/2-oxoglutarate dehydrogenase complex dihydrolipoamide dehydrogenase (E3) component
MAPHVLSVAFESHYSSQIEASLSKHGIKVRTGVGVQAFKGQRIVDTVVLSSGEEIKADIVFMAIGAFPNIDLALDCKLDLDARKAVKVNKYQQTSDPYIFAIGDCASKLDIFTGAESNVRLASIAAKEGRNAALNLSIQNAPLSVLGITNLFSTVIDDTYYAAAGMTKAQIEASPFRAIEVHLSAANKHPATLPGTVMTEGVFYFAADTLTLLGAQLSGDKEIAETINAIGIAIQNNATAHDLYSYLYGTQPMGTASPNMYILHQAGLKALSSKELL